MINDFIHAAMPWILIGLALAIFAAGAMRRNTGTDTSLSAEDQTTLKKRRNERIATSMAVGMLAGVIVGLVTPWVDIPAGASTGALMGAVVGFSLARRVRR